MSDQKPVSAECLRARFSSAADFTERPAMPGGVKVPIFYLDGLVSSSELSEGILRPMAEHLHGTPPERLLERCLNGAVYCASAAVCTDADDACRRLTNGFAVAVFPGDRAAAFELKGGEKRSPSPPEVENSVKGAKDAFTETLRTNTALLRRHLRLPELEIREVTVGRRSGTAVAVVSVRGLTDPTLPESLCARLRAIDIDGMLSPAAVEEYLTGSRKTAFPLLQYTERPDRFCRGLLDGQAGVLADGLPLGYLAPVNVGLLMTAAEDRGSNYVTASCVRVIRYLALLTALLLPALYVAMTRFHPAMIPTRLLRAIIESKRDVPFPTVAEVLGLLAAFELLQEAGLHLPQSIGQTVSIIGGLVVGTAAVEASLISPAALIAVSAAGICGFAVPEQALGGAVRVWRFVLTVCAALAGLFGMTMGLICLLVHLGGLESFGRPYLAPFSAVSADGALLRRRLVTQKTRDPAFRPLDRRKQR